MTLHDSSKHAAAQPSAAAQQMLHDADQREASLVAREARVETWEEGRGARKERDERILTEGDERDRQANDRDTAANKRDVDAIMSEFLHPDADADVAALRAREHAALNRRESRADRTASKKDRTEIAEDDAGA